MFLYLLQNYKTPLLNHAGVKYATLNKRGTSVKLEETKFRI